MTRHWLRTVCLAALAFLALPARAETEARPYPAPRIEGIARWFNSAPLRFEQLKGKVVLIDFWTYSCINCIRALPYVKAWYEKYEKDGLVVIGVHAPEFAFENDPANVEKAIRKFAISYPVAMDNDRRTWRNFRNQYWPAHYLIDRDGKVVFHHFGEGEYDVTEQAIRDALGLRETARLDPGHQRFSPLQTPETYLGRGRAERQSRFGNPPLHHWALSGDWRQSGEYLETQARGAALTLHYLARKVHLVMASADGKPKTVTIDTDGQARRLTVTESRLYDIAAGSDLRDATVRIAAEEPGLRLYAFTFGG